MYTHTFRKGSIDPEMILTAHTAASNSVAVCLPAGYNNTSDQIATCLRQLTTMSPRGNESNGREQETRPLWKIATRAKLARINQDRIQSSPSCTLHPAAHIRLQEEIQGIQ
jgi:hypothetical protein